MTEPPIALLVHGAWHGAWSWAALQARLDARGIPSLAVDLPGHGSSSAPATDLLGDVAHVVAVLDELGRRGHGRVVLVGHSYGGAVVSGAASGRADVAHLVYLAAFALEAGESVTSLIRSVEAPTPPLRAAIVPLDDGTTRLDPAHVTAALYGACDPAAVAAAIPRLTAQPAVTMTQALEASALGSIPSTYVRCTLDGAVPIQQQDRMASRCDRIVTFDTDHSPFLSRPDETADVIADIMGAVTSTTTGAPS
jgi:pimeloyl-ACP methyl ester carboxylesterase